MINLFKALDFFQCSSFCCNNQKLANAQMAKESSEFSPTNQSTSWVIDLIEQLEE